MRLLLSFVLLLVLNASSARAQTPCCQPDDARGQGEHNCTSIDFADAKNPSAKSNRIRAEQSADCLLARINEGVIRHFGIAWHRSGGGSLDIEGLVLIFRNPDGSYRAEEKGRTNQFRQFTFKWDPDAIAIVHTHPNNRNPRPQEMDIRIADSRGVLMFTITRNGMFMYDPATKRITKVKDGLDWLEPSMWVQDSRLARNQ